ncbi:hypothetical protein ACFP1G_03080 [Levilactobacillus tongjiangensis]|uniref:Transposase n=1 Tax=Levilactobacillus tongjiangensis TaxID=2486023 RepID=A0ABW1SPK9_9LACO
MRTQLEASKNTSLQAWSYSKPAENHPLTKNNFAPEPISADLTALIYTLSFKFNLGHK